MFFSKSEVQAFYKQDHENGQRLGQRFYTYFKLDRIGRDNQIWCDKLYEADDDLAKKMIAERTDSTQ